MPAIEFTESEVAAVWFIAARAMASAGASAPRSDDASAGLYAQGILGLSEQACLEAKRSDRFGRMTLVDCLAGLARMPADVAEKILTGALMFAFSEANLQPLQIRWASMMSSAASIPTGELQRCCASARVMVSMLRPHREAAS